MYEENEVILCLTCRFRLLVIRTSKTRTCHLLDGQWEASLLQLLSLAGLHVVCDAVLPSLKWGLLACCPACWHPRTRSRVQMRCHESASAMRPFGRKSLSAVVGPTVYSFKEPFQSLVLNLVGGSLGKKSLPGVCADCPRRWCGTCYRKIHPGVIRHRYLIRFSYLIFFIIYFIHWRV